MLKSLKKLPRLRRYYLGYEILSHSTYLLLMLFVVDMMVKLMGENGYTLKSVLVPALGLAIFIPNLSALIIKRPVRSYTIIVTLEVLAVFGLWLADSGYHSEIMVLNALILFAILKGVMLPLKDKNLSQVIDGDGEFSILRGRVLTLANTLQAVLGSAYAYVGYDSTSLLIGTSFYLIVSRFVYVEVMGELYVIENGKKVGYQNQ